MSPTKLTVADISAMVNMLNERQQDILKRLEQLETKQEAVTTIINKSVGAAAVLMTIGAVIGWLISTGANFLRWLH